MRHLTPLSAVLLLFCAGQLRAEVEDLREILGQLQEGELWSEAVFEGGRVRSMKVEEIKGDSVAVTEVLGPLQRQRATYALADFESLRELGPQRIQSRHAVYRSSKSMLSALALEAVVPGAGYLYVGETKQALALWALTGVAVATAVATGEDGAAGLAPLSAWIKVASLFQLRDTVQAINSNGMDMDVELGMLDGQQSTVPALRLRMAF